MISLPIDSHLDAILKIILENKNSIILSSPGSGKTTRLPAYLLRHFKRIWVLQPRRIAAISNVKRIADEQQWELGKQIGYEVRFDKSADIDTQIVFMTEAILRIKILLDPSLTNVDIIVFDEFHERTADADFCLAHVKDLQILGTAPKMVFLSATLNSDTLKNYLSNSVGTYHVNLPRFPTEVVYSKNPIRLIWDTDLEKKIVEAILFIISKNKTQILVFLPGLKEINRLYKALTDKQISESKLNNFDFQILHSTVELSIQSDILSNAKNQKKRIVLSTNIAESSLTIQGIDAVVDSGLHKESKFNFDYDTTEISLKKISLFSAIQRQGRSSRQGPGITSKLWTELDEKSFETEPVPEFAKNDLLIVGLSLLKTSKILLNNQDWFVPPPKRQVDRVLRKMSQALLVDNTDLTKLGDFCLKIGTDPDFALLLLLSTFFNLEKLAARLISCIENLDANWPHGKLIENTLDDFLYLEKNKIPWLVEKREIQILSYLSGVKNSIPFPNELNSLKFKEKNDPSVWKSLLGYCLFERIVQRRSLDTEKALNFFGKELILIPTTYLKNLVSNEFFINLKMSIDTKGMGRIEHFVSIEKSILESILIHKITTKDMIQFVDSKSTFVKYKQWQLGALTIKESTPETADKDFIKSQTIPIILKNWSELIGRNNHLRNSMGKLNWLQKITGEKPPLIIEKALEIELQKGLTLDNQFEWEFDLTEALEWIDKSKINTLLPSQIKFKESRRPHYIDYSQTDCINVECPLQALFGLNKHPDIADGRQRLRLIILGPHGRPIQITNDLVLFWKTSYPEIRKELRGRYPKHFWPENPTENK